MLVKLKRWNYKISQKIIAVGITLTSILIGYAEPARTNQNGSFKSFAEWCLKKDSLAQEARHTVERLLKEAKSSDCNQASDVLNKLTMLWLSSTQVSDIRPLSSLINLRRLDLNNNQISDLSPLSSLINLESLYLENNQISDISPLSSLNLHRLDLDNNQISDIRPLSSLTNLVYLYLKNNQVSDIKPLSFLTNLFELDLENNKISDFKPLASLPHLRVKFNNNLVDQNTCDYQADDPFDPCIFSDKAKSIYLRARQQYQQGQFQSALTSFQEALTIYQKSGFRKQEADVLNDIGDVHSNLGQYARSLEFYQQALSIRQELGDSGGRLYTLANLASVYEHLGQYQKALQILDKALESEPIIKATLNSRLIKDKFGISSSELPPDTIQHCERYSNSVWECDSQLSTHQSYRVVDWMTRAFYRLDNRNVMGQIFLSIASINIKRGSYTEALDSAKLALVSFRRDLTLATIQPNLTSNVIYGEANALDAVGIAYFQLDNSARALMFLQKALERMEKIGNKAGEGRVLNHLGELYFNQKQTQKSLKFYQQALPLRQQAKDIAGQGETLNNLGLLHFTQNQYPEAEKYLFDAIKVLEALRPGLKDDEKIAIFETQTVTYRLLQKVLIAQNKYNQALEISDRARARAFVELLAQRFTDSDDAQITPLTLQQIQRIAKEQNATLVEYSLVYDDFNINGKQQPEESELYIWVIQPTGEITFRRTDLKPLWQQQKTSLDKIVGEARCFENDACRQTLISARGVGNIPEIRRGLGAIQFNNAPVQSIAAAQRQQKNPQLQQLHQLLIEPIADILPKDPNNRVIFIPQSSLFLAPFPALQDEKGNYLIEKHTLLTAPSIQVLDLTRQQRQKLSPSLKEALVVGNPTMPKISPNFGEPPLQLSSLPGAETEAKEIAQLLNTTPLIGNQATESVVVQKMAGARIIHLATHGSFDPERGIGSWIALAPDSPTSQPLPTPVSKAGLIDFPAVHPEFKLRAYSSSPLKWTHKPSTSCSRFQPTLAMSQGINSLVGLDGMNQPCFAQGGVQEGESVQTTGKANRDGLLKAEEIVDLKLNAELVVLSACDTAQGKITGDGVVGLSRALISAGTPSVLVSLWKVDDEATAFLMREFYQNWQKSGDKAQALRQAMLTTKQKYPHPTFWAAFTVIGESE